MAEMAKDINFANDPAAIDFFGPAYINKDYHDSIKNVFGHIATFKLSNIWPGYRMNVRCGIENDSQKRCRKAGVIAYQWNTRKGEDPRTAPSYRKADAVSNMHFCDLFFFSQVFE
jgi:hypothetical protein